ncbi:host attachment family protein [Defluviimonas sp. WL0024]|uniref:Host attachment family protein n=2 Tax=Albidovulum TaxID=205889 RepID=A0ABT3J8Q0_9RHOB|nr:MULTISPECIES: host attachment family protein [Defluviimonas]MCU9849826.1 host attachment family protein [Defluviimonas sp. WL0024]MCW3784071.1 host attachment family protein [Defluviimonas salinarum]
MKPVRTLVLVAGEENARLLINDGIGKGLTERAGLSVAQFADAQIEYEDRPGRQTGGPGGTARHGFDTHGHDQEIARSNFAQHVVEAVQETWARVKPDRLIVAAPPKMLGALRAKLTGAPAAALHGDLAKDLVKVPVHDLPPHFADIQPM